MICGSYTVSASGLGAAGFVDIDDKDQVKLVFEDKAESKPSSLATA